MITKMSNSATPIKLSTKLAVFDFDWTLICPKNGTTWSSNKDDWKFLYDNTTDILKQYHIQGYSIVIVTYQSRQYKIDMIHEIITMFQDVIPITVIVSDKQTKKDFDIMDYLDTDIIDINTSFYCGDADGEQGSWSDMDRKFAEKNKLTFYKPADLFADNQVVSDTSMFPDMLNTILNTTLIIMCGSPASGKSTFVKEHLIPLGFSVVSSDTYNGNKKKMKKDTRKLIENKKRVVIDACNPTLLNRQDWRDIDTNMCTTTILMDAEKVLTIDRNSKRTVDKVPPVAIHSWYKRFERGDDIDIVYPVKTQ